jgi:hypothetical protein
LRFKASSRPGMVMLANVVSCNHLNHRVSEIERGMWWCLSFQSQIGGSDMPKRPY